jgi:hypothetical protein
MSDEKNGCEGGWPKFAASGNPFSIMYKHLSHWNMVSYFTRISTKALTHVRPLLVSNIPELQRKQIQQFLIVELSFIVGVESRQRFLFDEFGLGIQVVGRAVAGGFNSRSLLVIIRCLRDIDITRLWPILDYDRGIPTQPLCRFLNQSVLLAIAWGQDGSYLPRSGVAGLTSSKSMSTAVCVGSEQLNTKISV